MKRWTVIFRALANINRLEIIKLLAKGDSLSVGDIALHLKISIAATSNNLALLKSLDIVEALGADGHVFYSLNKQMPADIKKTIKVFLD